mmetsp:Transcript_26752/g.82140  ORF Transcript_26752/g.82140 Transcript_26752/m.82140 type:complete len:240 (-) Transcript_26752:199-918(-)
MVRSWRSAEQVPSMSKWPYLFLPKPRTFRAAASFAAKASDICFSSHLTGWFLPATCRKKCPVYAPLSTTATSCSDLPARDAAPPCLRRYSKRDLRPKKGVNAPSVRGKKRRTPSPLPDETELARSSQGKRTDNDTGILTFARGPGGPLASCPSGRTARPSPTPNRATCSAAPSGARGPAPRRRRGRGPREGATTLAPTKTRPNPSLRRRLPAAPPWRRRSGSPPRARAASSNSKAPPTR